MSSPGVDPWIAEMRTIRDKDILELREQQARQQKHAKWEKWRRRGFVGLVGAIIGGVGAGYVTHKQVETQQAQLDEQRLFGATGQLEDVNELRKHGACSDELGAMHDYHDSISVHSYSDSILRDRHSQAAARFGRAATLAEQNNISCQPEGADSWRGDDTLTPGFDVVTLTIAHDCAPKLQAKRIEAMAKPSSGPNEAAIKLERQEALASKYKIACE